MKYEFRSEKPITPLEKKLIRFCIDNRIEKLKTGFYAAKMLFSKDKKTRVFEITEKIFGRYIKKTVEVYDKCH